MNRFLAIIMPALFGAAALSGCSVGGSATLTGKITFQGRTVAYGSVSVVNEKGEFGTAEIQADGTYTVTDCPKGTVKIAVVSVNPEVAEKRNSELFSAARGNSGPPMKIASGDPKLWFEIPGNYGDIDQSGITTEVSGGENKFDIVMQ